MADIDRKWLEGVAGRYFVDESCIDCDLCRITAPDNFTANEEKGHSYVYRQPRTKDEEALCSQALGECPVEAIGDGGDGDAAGDATSDASDAGFAKAGKGGERALGNGGVDGVASTSGA